MADAQRTLREISESVHERPQLQQAIFKLIQAGSLLDEFTSMAENDRHNAERVIAAAVASLANVCTVQGGGDELKRRADGN